MRSIASSVLSVSRPSVLLLALAALGLGSGCSFFPAPAADPTRHYILTGPTADAINEGMRSGTLRVGVRTVRIAPYLDGKAMIVRHGENEIRYRDYARWAEPLDSGIQRMLVASLHLSDKVARVLPQPFPFDVTRDVDVTVNILRCEGRVKADGQAVVSFLCELELVRVADTNKQEPSVLLREVFEAPETPWREGDYAGLAAALSADVGRLAERIIAALPATLP
jgi:uncharacterized protein